MNEALLKKFYQIEKEHWWWEGRRELLKILIRKMLKSPPKKILDIGCGTGETLSFLKRLYPKSELFGVDNSASAVRFSRLKGHRVIKTDATNLCLKSNHFDLILFLDVLEHIKNQKKALLEAKRFLRRGGIIIITSPALPFIWSNHDKKQGHFRRYNKQSIQRIAKAVGLDIGFFSYFNFIFSIPIIIIRVISNFKPLQALVDYDNKINYDIAHNKLLNKFLKFIFKTEIKFLRFTNYPIGISIVTVLLKPKNSS